MKRRSFIKKSAAGLSTLALGAGASLGQSGKKGAGRRLYGMPDSVRLSTPAERNLVRYSVAQSELPPEVWDDLVAVSMLARDVFEHPEVAAAFSRDPKGYLETIGLGQVTLDPQAVEVKVALAAGDPEVRRAIAGDDPGRFLALLEERGLLSTPEPSQIAARLSAHIERIRTMAGVGETPEACSVTAVCLALVLVGVWVWVAAIQDVLVAVTVAAAAQVTLAVLLFTTTIGPRMMVPEAGVLRQHAPFRLAGALGGVEFADSAITMFIDDNAERIARAVEDLSLYQKHQPMPAAELRTLVRRQMIRQLSGQIVSPEAEVR